MSTREGRETLITDAAIEEVARRRIAINLSHHRVRYGWSTSDFANRAGLTVPDIERIEANIDPLAIDRLPILAKALDVPVERLLDERADRTH